MKVIASWIAKGGVGKSTLVGQTTKATESQTAHKFLAEYDPGNKVLGEYKRLAKVV